MTQDQFNDMVIEGLGLLQVHSCALAGCTWGQQLQGQHAAPAQH